MNASVTILQNYTPDDSAGDSSEDNAKDKGSATGKPVALENVGNFHAVVFPFVKKELEKYRKSIHEIMIMQKICAIEPG